MKAAAFFKTGGPQVLEFIKLPDPVPGPSDVIIEMKAIGLNFADIYRRRGIYSSEAPSPYVLGYEGAGIVVGVGCETKEFSLGQRVAFAHVPRANAELVKAAAWKVIPLPDDISFESAAGLLLQGLTAHYLTHDSVLLKPSDTVLIHSASGGVGLLLTQLCQIIGAKAIGTVSTKEKRALALEAGAHHVVLRSKTWPQQVLELSGGLGVNVVFDAIGTTLLDSLSVIKPRGVLVYYGQAGGAPPHIDPNLLMADSKVLVGGELWSHIATRESLLRRADILFSWLRQGDISLSTVTKFPLSQAARAHEELESGRSQGKILLMTDEVNNN